MKRSKNLLALALNLILLLSKGADRLEEEEEKDLLKLLATGRLSNKGENKTGLPGANQTRLLNM